MGEQCRDAQFHKPLQTPLVFRPSLSDPLALIATRRRKALKAYPEGVLLSRVRVEHHGTAVKRNDAGGALLFLRLEVVEVAVLSVHAGWNHAEQWG